MPSVTATNSNPNDPGIIRFVFFPALTLWLGWGIRGLFGHANGALIPGALLGLAICVLLKADRYTTGLAVAMTAVGFGFGADETTLQTAGYLMGTNPDHLVKLGLAYSGLALKGALWAMLGGAGLGLALAAHLYRQRDVAIGGVILIAAFYVGWWAVNRPRLIYFSLDRPEIWCGLLLGGVALLAWLTVRGGTHIPLQLAGWAALGGGIGYPVAVTLASLGRHSAHAVGYDWWKLAETTFGGFMGASVGLGVYLSKDKLPERAEIPKTETPAGVPQWLIASAGALGVAIANSLYAGVAIGGTSRAFQTVVPWIILGPVLWCAAFWWNSVAWQIGVTMTFFATAIDVALFWRHDEQVGNAALLWVLVGLATMFVAWRAAGWRAGPDGVARKAYLFLVWSMMALSYFVLFAGRAALAPAPSAVEQVGGRLPYLQHAWGAGLLVGEAFTVAALALTWMVASS
jgi:hypothetical protein